MAHPSKSVLMAEIRLTYGDPDVIGDTLRWAFAIADVLWHHDPASIPAEWQYTHGLLCQAVDDDYPDCEVEIMLLRGHATVADLVYAGNVLWRYTSWLTMVPADFPVRSLTYAETLTAQDPVQCGECGRQWDDAIVTSMTPAPAARCPFEAFHRD